MIDFFDVLRGRHLILIFVIVGYPPTGKYGAQVVLAAQFLARIVQAPAKTKATIVRVDQYIQPVHGIAFGVVQDLIAMTNQVVIGMRVAELLVVHLYGQGHTYQLAAINNADLPFRKVIGQFLDSGLFPRTTNIVVDPIHQILDLRIVIHR